LPRAHDLDLLDNEIEPGRLPAAGSEEQEPQDELQSAECSVFHRLDPFGRASKRAALNKEWTFGGPCGTDR
jgi:hypothetical protein